MDKLIEDILSTIVTAELYRKGLIYECPNCGKFHVRDGVTEQQFAEVIAETLANVSVMPLPNRPQAIVRHVARPELN